MPEKPIPPRKLSDKNTKQEMLDAYQTLLVQVEQKRAAELNPARRLEEKRSEEAIKVAEAQTPDGVDRALASLKSETSKFLADIADKLAAETVKFKSVQKAIEAKERELQDLYGIEKAAASLAALIEAQNAKRREFEAELAEQEEKLKQDIETTRTQWELDKKTHELEMKERDAAEKKARDREKEEYAYAFKREQQTVRDKLNDEKSGLEKEIHQKRETATRDLAEREKAVAEKETELNQLRARVAAFPKELESSVDKATKEVTDRLKAEARNREDLLRKEFEGERNVSATRIELLERAVKDLTDNNARLAKQAEAAYQKIQEIAEKAIEGSSQAKSLADLQKLLLDQGRKPVAEKS